MSEVVSELLREHLSPTVSYVGSLIAIQRAYINTNHPDFLGAAGAMASLENDGKRKKRLDKKRVRQKRKNHMCKAKEWMLSFTLPPALHPHSLLLYTESVCELGRFEY